MQILPPRTAGQKRPAARGQNDMLQNVCQKEEFTPLQYRAGRAALPGLCLCVDPYDFSQCGSRFGLRKSRPQSSTGLENRVLKLGGPQLGW